VFTEMDGPTGSTAETLVAQGDPSVAAGAWVLKRQASTTALQFIWRESGGTTRTATSSTGLAQSAGRWYRATLDVSNGSSVYEVTFYYSDDPVTTDPASVSWTQHGTSVTGAAATTINDGTAALSVGNRDDEPSEALDGRIYKMQLRNGIGGTVVANANFTADNQGAASSTALLVVADSTTPTAGDAILKGWLEDHGYTVTYISDEAVEGVATRWLGALGATVGGVTVAAWSGAASVVDSTSNAIETASTDLTIDKPTGVQEGDVLYAQIITEDGVAPTVTPPTGWSVVQSITSDGGGGNWHSWKKTATASEPASYTWQSSTSNQQAGAIIAVRGGTFIAHNSGAPDTVSPIPLDLSTGGVEPTLAIAFVGIDASAPQANYFTAASGTWTRQEDAFATSGATINAFTSTAPPLQGIGYDLVVIAESCTSTVLTTKYKDSASPVLHHEHAAWDDHNLTSAGGATGTGSTFDVTDSTHPIAAMLSGTGLTMYDSGTDYRYTADGNLPSGANVVISAGGTSNRIVVAYNSGATLQASDTAENKRVLFQGLDGAYTNFNWRYRQVWDAAVMWLTGDGDTTGKVWTAAAGATWTLGSTDRRSRVSFAEFEVPSAPRRSQVSFAELETGNAGRRGQVSWAEIEFPTAPRRSQVSFAELEVPTAPRRGQVSFAELEVADPPRRGQIAWAEMEVPNGARRSQVSWAELETGDGGRRGQVSWAVFETDNPPRRAQVSFSELETTDGGRRAQVAWAEVEFQDAPRRALISFAETEVPTAPRRGQVSFTELETGDAPRRGAVAWAEFEVPSLGERRGQVAWAELETGDAPRRGQITFAEFETGDPPRRGQVSFTEMEVGDAPRRAQVSFTEVETPDIPPRRAQVAWAELEIPTAARRGTISFAEYEVPDAARRAAISWSELEVPTAPRRSQVSFAELETDDGPRRAQLSWSEYEVPTAPRRAQVSWSEFEVPDGQTNRRALVSWAVFVEGQVEVELKDILAILAAMLEARGHVTPKDFAGALRALSGTDLDPVGALQAMGATRTEVLGAVNELAGTVSNGFLEAFREWARSGNY